ncbi:MAG: Fis family transcriptional regulator [Actinomycetota bacterium]|nr:Fis family transcriptional regulator [Actinomycetota bacterium]
MPARDSTGRLGHVKDRVLSSDEPAKHVVRDQIMASWRRSKFWGVSADHLEPPYSDAVELENRLVAAARPVIDRLEATLADSAMSIILTNAHGQVLQRHTDEQSLKRQLDSICLAPGFSYAEEHVGTNGIGSAIECRRPFFVQGAEHFSDSLGTVSCAGAPIVDPLTGRLQGVIDLTCRATDATPLMKVLAENAAADITRVLLERSSARERALLQAFLAATHASNRAIVAMGQDLFISNAKASGILDRADHVLVEDCAAELVNTGGSAAQVLLSSGDTAHLKARPVEAKGGEPGLIIELSVAETWGGTGTTALRPHPAAGTDAPSTAEPGRAEPGTAAAGTAGRSGSWAVTQERVEECCRDRSCLLLVGEAGTGKLALLDAAHRRWNRAGRMTVLDAAQLGDGFEAVQAELDRHVDPDVATVVLRHLDLVPDAAWPAIRDWLERQGSGMAPWITGTSDGTPQDSAPGEQLCGLAVVVAVPALRHRIEDVRDLVPEILRRMAPGRDIRVGPAAMQTLLRHPWPGNVGELEEVLRAALSRRPRGRIMPEDLPEMVHSTSRQALSLWESMERDLVTRALLETRGDKVRAASRLGISRATIYRKIRAYGIVVRDGEDAE